MAGLSQANSLEVVMFYNSLNVDGISFFFFTSANRDKINCFGKVQFKEKLKGEYPDRFLYEKPTSSHSMNCGIVLLFCWRQDIAHMKEDEG